MSDQKVAPSGLDEEVDPPVNTRTEVNEEHEEEEQVNEDYAMVTGEEVDVEVQPDGVKSSALPALLEPQTALVVAGDDADKSKIKHHSSLHSAKGAAYSLFMPLQDAIASLKFDENVLLIAMIRLLSTIVTCVCVVVLLNSATFTRKICAQVSTLTNALAPTSDSISKLDSTVQFRDIDSVDDIYKWLTDTFIPSVFVSTDHNGNPLPEHLRGRVALNNKVLGGVILEMIPFEFNECDPDTVLTELYPNCTYTNNAARSINFLDIDMDAADAKTAITDLKANGSWVNYRTKQLITTLATYNGIETTITVTRLTIDFRASGFFEMNALVKPIPDTRGSDFAFRISLLVVVYAEFSYLVYRLERLHAPRGKNPEGVVQNAKRVFGVVRLGVLKYGAAVAFFGLYVRFMTFNVQDELLALADNTAKTSQETYGDTVAGVNVIHTAASWNNLVTIVGGGVIFQQGLSILHQLRFHPQLNLFALTGIRALRQFRAFAIIFAIVFLTYAAAGNILFGGRVLQFSTAQKSMESCVNMVFGEFDYGNISKIRSSGVYYWSYLIIVSVILLNMMLAIVMGAYDDMSKETYHGTINVLLVNRMTQYIRDLFYRMIRRYKYVRKSTRKVKAYLTEPSDDDEEELENFKALGFDARKLTRDDLLQHDKILPSFLLPLLRLKLKRENTKAKLEADEAPSRSSTMITLSMVQALFPAALLSDEELVATFNHLHEGFILHEAVTKRDEKKAEQTKQSSEPVKQELSSSLKKHQEPLKTQLPDEFASLPDRVSGLEQKLDKLLEAVLARQ